MLSKFQELKMEELSEWGPTCATTAMVVAGAAAAAGVYYVTTRPEAKAPIFPLHDQSILEPVSYTILKVRIRLNEFGFRFRMIEAFGTLS